MRSSGSDATAAVPAGASAARALPGRRLLCGRRSRPQFLAFRRRLARGHARDRAQAGEDRIGVGRRRRLKGPLGRVVRNRRQVSLEDRRLPVNRTGACVELEGGLGLDVVEADCGRAGRLRRVVLIAHNLHVSAGFVQLVELFQFLQRFEVGRLGAVGVGVGGMVSSLLRPRIGACGRGLIVGGGLPGSDVQGEPGQAGGVDLRLHLADGGLGFGRDSQSCPLGRGRGLRPRSDQFSDPSVQSLAADRHRFQQAVADDAQLLHLDPVRVALVGQVRKDPLPHVAGLDHQIPALLAALLDDGGGDHLGLGVKLVALSLGALQPLLARIAGGLQHAGRLIAQGLHRAGRVKLFYRCGLELGDALLERGDQGIEAADLRPDRPQPAADRLGLVAAAHRAEVGLLDRLRVQPCASV